MDSILRGLFVYLALLLIFRISGKQTLSQMTGFDLILLLIISETIQQAMVDSDHSVTNGLLLVITLVGTTILLAWLKQKFPGFERILDGQPVIVVDRGKPNQEVMDKSRVDEDDIMSAARKQHGLERMEQIKYAVLERDGGISIIPREKS